MGNSIYERVMVRSTGNGNFYRPPAATLPKGEGQMTLVCIGHLRDAAISGQILFDNRSPGNDGFVLYFLNGAIFWRVHNGAAAFEVNARVFTAQDVNKVHIIFGTLSISSTSMAVYLNQRPTSGVGPAAYSTTGIVTQTVLDNNAGSAALTGFDVIDLALLQGYSINANDAHVLSDEIRASGRIPNSFARWDMLMRAERLADNPEAWQAGGLQTGNGLLRTGSVTLGAVLVGDHPHCPWGGQ